MATRVLSVLAFNIPGEARPERTLERAEKADQTDEFRESVVGRSEDTGCLSRTWLSTAGCGDDSQVYEKAIEGPIRNVEGVFKKSYECGVRDGLLCGSKRRIQGVVCIRDP